MYLTDGILFFFSFFFMECSDHLRILSFQIVEIYKVKTATLGM